MDENLNLLLGIDGKPLPQQKDAKGINDMQVVEGSDGAQHVKITDLTGDPFDIKQSLENLNASIKANKTTPIEEINVSNFPPIQNVKDVDVKEELALIKQENIEIKNAQAEIITALGESNASLQATNNTLLSVIKDDRLQSDTKVTGSNYEEIEVIERGVYSSLKTKRVDAPIQAKGVMINIYVYNLTGNFEGGNLELYSGMQGGKVIHSRTTYELRTGNLADVGTGRTHTLLWYPNADLKDAILASNRVTKISNMPPTRSMVITVLLSGDFEEGEGVDYEVGLTWLYE